MAKEIRLPDVGEGIETGTVVSVLVNEGDVIEVDQGVIELETDKAVVEVPSTAAGRVASINVTPNSEISVGQVILTLEEGETAAAEAADAGEEPAADAAGPDEAEQVASSAEAAPKPAQVDPSQPTGADRAQPASQPAAAPAAGSGAGGTIPAAPSVRRIARERGIDLSQVRGTGILGRISVSDLDAHQAAPAAAAAAPAFRLPDFSRWGETRREPMSGIRKATVRSMTTAWATVPMVTHFDKADTTELEALRKRYQPRAEAAGTKLTPTAILVKIIAAALKRFPEFNASIDTETEEIIYKDYVHITVAVDTDQGLLVPVIKDADRKNLIELSVELAELAEKARERKLTPDEMQGGNFSISNLGGIGGTGFTPIVTPPQVAILGVARSSMEQVYDRTTGEFTARLMLPLALTYDHRLIDGAEAARFLRWVCQSVEEPFLIALEG